MPAAHARESDHSRSSPSHRLARAPRPRQGRRRTSDEGVPRNTLVSGNSRARWPRWLSFPHRIRRAIVMFAGSARGSGRLERRFLWAPSSARPPMRPEKAGVHPVDNAPEGRQAADFRARWLRAGAPPAHFFARPLLIPRRGHAISPPPTRTAPPLRRRRGDHEQASRPGLGDSLMVERRILTPLVLVRVQVPQPISGLSAGARV